MNQMFLVASNIFFATSGLVTIYGEYRISQIPDAREILNDEQNDVEVEDEALTEEQRREEKKKRQQLYSFLVLWILGFASSTLSIIC